MISNLDYYFPYIVLIYGLTMTLVTQFPLLHKRLAESDCPELLHWFYGHRMLGGVCLMVGSLWSLQRVWFW